MTPPSLSGRFAILSAGRTTRIIDPDGDTEVARYKSSNIMPDHTGRMHEAKSSPEASRELMLRIRRSNVQLGDGRIKVMPLKSCPAGLLFWDGVDGLPVFSCFLCSFTLLITFFSPYHVVFSNRVDSFILPFGSPRQNTYEVWLMNVCAAPHLSPERRR